MDIQSLVHEEERETGGRKEMVCRDYSSEPVDYETTSMVDGE